MSTFVAKKETVEHNWLVIDASNQVVGRLAVVISNLLRGKHRPDYTPHVDTGDFVIVVNANKVKFTGKKWDTQTYRAYSHYPGGLKTVGAKELLERKPEMILEQAVKRMMPKNRLAKHQISKLKIYAGPNHPHQAQDPQEFKVEAK
ncbi:MAG TPA: 50S ribosomal protein L13 [Gemmataceae bacterium]|nr:50S ribosomal protein L13 [Gemmataceae bacterium]